MKCAGKARRPAFERTPAPEFAGDGDSSAGTDVELGDEVMKDGLIGWAGGLAAQPPETTLAASVVASWLRTLISHVDV